MWVILGSMRHGRLVDDARFLLYASNIGHIADCRVPTYEIIISKRSFRHARRHVV